MDQLRKLGMCVCAVIVGLYCVSAFGQVKKIAGPKDVAGLVLWLDAADANSITMDASKKVSEWKDKSDKGFSAEQSDPAAQPVYSTTAVNQLPGVVFNGTTAEMDIASFGQNMFTAFVVGSRTNEVQNPLERIDTAYNRGFVVGNQTEAFNYFPQYRVNGVAAQAASDWLNNLAVVTGINGTQVPGGFKVGFGSPGYAPLNGPLAEVLIYNRVLTADEITSVEQYLGAKWKIKVSGK